MSNHPQSSNIEKAFDPTFITSDSNAQAMIQFCEQLGGELGKMSSSQIRRAYGQLKKIEMEGWQGDTTYRKILLLKPQLAYAAQRHKDVKPLKNVLEKAIDAIDNNGDNFKRFCEFFEAILAYHKAKGGS